MPTERPYQFVPVDVPITRRAQVGRLLSRVRFPRLLGGLAFWGVMIYLFVSGWLLTVAVLVIILSCFGVKFGYHYNRYGTWTRSNRR